jgi:hypothetical protein
MHPTTLRPDDARGKKKSWPESSGQLVRIYESPINCQARAPATLGPGPLALVTAQVPATPQAERALAVLPAIRQTEPVPPVVQRMALARALSVPRPAAREARAIPARDSLAPVQLAASPRRSAGAPVRSIDSMSTTFPC